jgi:leucyl aminopeptidase
MKTNALISYKKKSDSFNPDSNNVVILNSKFDKPVLQRELKKVPDATGQSMLELFEDSAEVQSATVFLSEGGSLSVAFFGEVSRYDKQTQLRKLFSKVSKNTRSKKYVFDVSKNTSLDQISLIEDLLILTNTFDWQPEKFSKNTSKKESSKKSKDENLEVCILTTLESKRCEDVTEWSLALSESINSTRTLGDLPGNILGPDDFRKRVEKQAKELGYKTKFYSFAELKKMGAGAFVAVTQGQNSKTNPCGILHLYQSKKPSKPKKKITFVGKGVCFDTGGYNIKTGSYMYDMHRDMFGAAVALGAFEAAIQSFEGYEFEAYLALAENLISDTAYRPSDVVYAANGMSIEVVNTDAEGRMVLADTLVLASKPKPDLILNFATLTGSAVRAIGTRRSAVFGNNDRLRMLAHDAGDASGERVWAFPHGEDYLADLKSDVADILQCSRKANADHILGATFLEKFIEDGVDWVHMDLSAETNSGGLGLIASETTAFGIRWASNMVCLYSESKESSAKKSKKPTKSSSKKK